MNSNRRINFGAGPAALPQSVLDKMAEAVLDYDNSGISILSIAHREKAFARILAEATALILQLTNLRANDYEVLWLQGGGRHQFAMLPMNFLGEGMTAGYVDSGFWAHDAMTAAQYYGNVVSLSSSAEEKYRHLPEWPADISSKLAYVHMTTNNTIYGTQWPGIPDCELPLVADMSSDIFSVERDYSKCALFYAVAQKNLGPAGVTVVVVRKDMLPGQVRAMPESLSYAGQARAHSLLNTPPVPAIYACLLTLRWIIEQGMDSIITNNKKKAEILYAEIDRNDLFTSPVAKNSRSLMNVVFAMKDPSLEGAFLEFCAARNIVGINGHRSVGGFRASLYNAVSLEDVQALVAAMGSFNH